MTEREIGGAPFAVDGGSFPWPAKDGLVKICGLRRPEDARAAAVAGADLLGFIFAPAGRQVSADTAQRCRSAANEGQQRTNKPLAVGVFVDASVDDMNATADKAGLDLVQLHGDEAPALLARLNRPVIKVLRPLSGTSVDALVALISSYAGVPNAPVAYLIEGFSPTAHGGAGVQADWALVSALAGRHRIILAGGLNESNVGDAIYASTPFAVDVSSGVERDGCKDPERIGAFVRMARSAFLGARPAHGRLGC